MYLRRFALAGSLLVAALAASAISGCKGGGAGGVGGVVPSAAQSQMSRLAPPMSLVKPASVSPGSVAPPPMAITAILPSSAMQSPTHVAPQQTIQGSSWTEVPGSASQVVSSPDGTLWVLGTTPAGSNKNIWHYANGAWTNIPGLASNIAVSPSGTLYAVNSAGGIYVWGGSSWSVLAGGASAITIASDGSIYVLANGGAGDQAIWHYVSGTWSELPGAGIVIAANWDTNGYTTPGGSVPAGGFYILNSLGYIYHGTSAGAFVPFTGVATAIAPSRIGGIFVLGYPGNATTGNEVWYYNLNSPGAWIQESGAGTSASAYGTYLYLAGSTGAIYSSPVVSTQTVTGPGTPLTGPTVGPTPYSAWGPPGVATSLQYPVQQGYDGTGQTVAVVIDSDVSRTDLSTYFTYFSIPTTSRTILTESVDGGTGLTAGQGESTLDVETIGALAPGANIIIYEMPDLSGQSIVDAYNQVVSDGKASVVSSSFGGCEVGVTTEHTVFQQGAQEGIAFVASSGDQGNNCYNGSGYSPGVNDPASDPNVIGVGGTDTYPPKLLTSTVVWNDSTCGVQCGGGGGVSATWSIPAFQSDVSGSPASTTMRNVPDVSMPAEYDAEYEAGAWGGTNGTSWSAPEFAALMAEVYEYCGTSLANPVSVPYYVFQKDGYSAFIDVTSGNDQYNSTTPYYTAGTGYDSASGIGVPLGKVFAQQACPGNTPAAVVRRGESTTAYAALRPAQALSLNVAPAVRGLIDQGRRTSIEQTRIQIVLEPTATLASDEQTVIGLLQAAGFTIVKTFSNHLVVDAQAPSGTVEQFFSTQIHDFSQAQYGVRYMPVARAIVPASMAPYVAGMSLDNVVNHIAPNPIRI